MKVRIPIWVLAALAAITFYAVELRADTRTHQQPVPEAVVADFTKMPRAVVMFSICGHVARLYFTTSDGRPVQVSGNHNVPTATIAAAVLGAAMFDALNVTGPQCAEPSPTNHADGAVDL